jgi:acyl-CoA synthetase (AMP-forming)/AMP-acid ligase II
MTIAEEITNPEAFQAEPMTAPSEAVNVSHYLRTMARICPYKRAVVCPAGRDASGRVSYSHLTFRQLDHESDCLAHGLSGIGIQRGIRTILMVRPSIEFFTLIFSLFKIGAVPVVVDPGMGLRRMLACLCESRSEALIGIPLAHVLRISSPRSFKNVKKFVTAGHRWFWGGPTLSQLYLRPHKHFTIARTRLEETAAILFTTGSTGPAKGVVYTHGVFDAQVRTIRSHFGFTSDEIDLPTFPLFSLFDPALGITAIIPDMDPTRPAEADPKKIIEAIRNQGVTQMFASPALLNRVGRFGKKQYIKLPSLKRVISSGAPVSPAIIKTFSTLLSKEAEIHTGYGATEAMPIMTIGSHEILSDTLKLTEKGYGVCIGRPVEGVTVAIIKISDDPISQWTEDLPASNGEIGEIVVSGELVTSSYFERPKDDALAKIKDDDRFWHRMGDLGWLDNKGRVWFCGRKSQRVVAPGKTYFTIPCEAIFNTHPQVFRSALVGIGPPGKQEPVICIELESASQGMDKARLRSELLTLAKTSVLTDKIETILFHPQFPVDVRHNAKIFREKLAIWAQRQTGGGKLTHVYE